MKTLKLIILLSLLTVCKTGYSQCQPVCVVGGVTVTPSGTSTVVVSNTVAVSGTVTALPAGNQSVTVTNTVAVTGTVTAIGGGTVTVSNPFLKETTYRDSVHATNDKLSVIDNDIQAFQATNTQNLDDIKDTIHNGNNLLNILLKPYSGQPYPYWVEDIDEVLRAYLPTGNAQTLIIANEQKESTGEVSVFKQPNTDKSYFDNSGTQVKIFSNATLAGLETDINTWLTANPAYRVLTVGLGNLSAIVQYNP